MAEVPPGPYPSSRLPTCPEVITILILIFIIPVYVLICYMWIYSQKIYNFVLHIFKLYTNGTIHIIPHLLFFFFF